MAARQYADEIRPESAIRDYLRLPAAKRQLVREFIAALAGAIAAR